MLRIQYGQFDGLILTFHPSKEGTDLALKVLAFIEGSVNDPANKEVAKYFRECLEGEAGELQ